MPRRALLLITTLVLALHWLVLHGLPLDWDSPAPPTPQVFSTRSIALPPPPAAPSPAVVAAAAPPRAPAQAAPAAVAARKKARPQPPQDDAPLAQAEPQPGPATPPELSPAETAAPPSAEAPETVAAAEAAPSPAPAPPPTAPDTQHAASPPPPEPEAALDAGVDIRPPGSGTDQASSTAPPPVRIPPPQRLHFEVAGQAKKFNYTARAELLWQHDGNRYEARQEVSVFLLGSRSQRSTGSLTDQGLLPERFGDKSRSEQAAHFDYAKGRVTFSANTPEAPIRAGAQDRLSLFIQLGALLAADPGRFVPGTQLSLTTVSAKTADRWTFTVEGPETLDLPLGATPTLKLQRLPRRDYDQKAELWVAPSLGYLPVRIKLTQSNGDFADLRLRSSSPP